MESVKLKHLVQGIPDFKIKGSKEIEITGLSADSKTVAPGNLFIAKKGTLRDGVEFIPQAVLAGASAILTPCYDPFLKVTQIIHEKPGNWEAKLAARYYRFPSKELWVVGITGTKGKTTTSYLIHHLLNHLGKPAGLAGTIEMILGSKKIPSSLTTQDAIRNQKLLREMVAAGEKAAVLEVSSHGLDQGRVEEIEFDLAIFTNLYPDHLDYHKTMEEYAAAKKKLFGKAKTQIFNADSPYFSYMKGDLEGMTYGISEKADLRVFDIDLKSDQTTFQVEFRGKKERFSTSFLGRFHVHNFLAAIATGLHLGADLPSLSSIFSNPPQIPGRLEAIENTLGFHVFVDFAHEGESLDSILSTLREIGKKRLLVVFGCGGGRDPARRRGMASAAEKWADLAIVTTDNSRQEDPNEITRQILAAFKNREKTILEIDRKKAIELAIQEGKAGDIILIAGKGHERVQIFGNQSVPFDDCLVAKEALQNRSASAILS